MRLGPWLVLRGVLAVIVFIILACITLTHASPGAAEGRYKKQNSPGVSDTTQFSKNCRVSNRFPDEVRQWCNLIVTYADANNLEPDLIAGLIWYESGGNPKAYSRSGAVGLMQVMPRDGLAAEFMCVNGPCFANRPSQKDLENPEFNIEYGTRMLSGLYNRHQSLREALKYYGPSGAGYTYAEKVLSIYENYRME